MTDEELTQRAAIACGMKNATGFSPLTDDGDALRLAVKLRIDFYTSNMNGLSERTEENAVVCHTYDPTVPVSSLVSLSEPFGDDPYAATRRAITRAAAALVQWPNLRTKERFMCWCTPNIRTPFCGKIGCVPPQQRTHDGLPIIPGQTGQPTGPADGAVAQCGVCGLRIMPVMGYVCGNPRCGVFPRVT